MNISNPEHRPISLLLDAVMPIRLSAYLIRHQEYAAELQDENLDQRHQQAHSGNKPLSFVQAVWEALSSVTASEVSSCINHGISNLDAAGSVLNSMQPPGDKAHQIPVVQCSRLIS